MAVPMQIYQAPLAECVYFPEEILFILDEDLEMLAKRMGFRIETHWADGLGPADGVFLMSDAGSSCILFRYRYLADPATTLVGCEAKEKYSAETIQLWRDMLAKH